MGQLIWYIYSFLLGGILGAPILAFYVYYLLQRYIQTEATKVITDNKELLEEKEKVDGSIVSKVGWLKISHDGQLILDNSNNITGILSNSIHSFLERKQPTPLKRSKDTCYCVLKGTKLLIYDNGSRNECRGVILLTEFTTTIYPIGLPDNEVFKKEFPIMLKYKLGEDTNVEVSSDYYLFCDSPVEKENWYLALLKASQPSKEHDEKIKPDPLTFDKQAIQGLIDTINGSDDHQQTKWLNGLIGRLFLGIYRTQAAKDYFINKIKAKTTKVKKPGFLGDFKVRDLQIGDSIPYITNPKLISLSVDGELCAEMDLSYSGGFKVEIETDASLSVSTRLKPLKVSMVLAVVLRSLRGKILLRVKPPPTNRFWIGFYALPQMDLSIEPIISDTHIKSTVILQAIEKRIMDLIKDALVLPNMDDYCFFPSFGTGGIFDLVEHPTDPVDVVEPATSLSNLKSDTDSTTTSSDLDSIKARRPVYFMDEPTEICDRSSDAIDTASSIDSNKSKANNGNLSKPASQATSLNDKIRNLRESYFSGRLRKSIESLGQSASSQTAANTSTSGDLRLNPSASLSSPQLPSHQAESDMEMAEERSNTDIRSTFTAKFKNITTHRPKQDNKAYDKFDEPDTTHINAIPDLEAISPPPPAALPSPSLEDRSDTDPSGKSTSRNEADLTDGPGNNPLRRRIAFPSSLVKLKEHNRNLGEKASERPEVGSWPQIKDETFTTNSSSYLTDVMQR